MLHYKTTMKYSEESIRALCQTQYSVYDGWKATLLILLCIAGMSLAVTTKLSQVGTVLVIGVCGICVSLATYPPKYKAKATISAMNGVFPETEYFFFEDDILLKSGSGEKREDYSIFERLQHDEKFIYLFISKTQAYILDKQRILPSDPDGLLGFLAQKTGKRVYRSRGGSKLGLRTLLFGTKR